MNFVDIIGNISIFDVKLGKFVSRAVLIGMLLSPVFCGYVVKQAIRRELATQTMIAQPFLKEETKLIQKMTLPVSKMPSTSVYDPYKPIVIGPPW